MSWPGVFAKCKSEGRIGTFLMAKTFHLSPTTKPRLDDWRISSISSQVRAGIETFLAEHVGPVPDPRGLPAPGLRPPAGMKKAYHRWFEPGKSGKAGAQRFRILGRFVGWPRIDFFYPTAITTWNPVKPTHGNDVPLKRKLSLPRFDRGNLPATFLFQRRHAEEQIVLVMHDCCDSVPSRLRSQLPRE